MTAVERDFQPGTRVTDDYRPKVAFTPNPAIDRILDIGAPLRANSLHRVRKVIERAGGKGVNLARAVQRVQGTETAPLVVAGFLAGWNGRKFRALLDDEDLQGLFVEVPGETRECQIVLAGEGQPTEVNEPGPHVTIEQWHKLFAALPEGCMVISGSLPPGIDPTEFQGLLEGLARRPVVDTSGPALVSALRAKVRLVSPNRAELASALGLGSAGVREAKQVFERYGVPVLLSLGREGAAYVGEQSHMAVPPAIEVLNPVGAGDALLGVFLWAQGEGCDEAEALRWAVAAGTASARVGGTARLTRHTITEVRERIEVRPG